ncbi:hypothetical protein VH1709_contig00043-0116 [Vibrio harveyi]|nr:hypothetical protein VH1709_contig00043-0116 [Vibrio harveyi]
MNIVYIEDFVYVGHHYPELKHYMDFDFLHQLYFTIETGWLRIQPSEVKYLYREWEKRFINQVQKGRYDEIKISMF